VATGFVNPWGFAFLPGGDILVTERGGAVKLLSDVGALRGSFTGMSGVANAGQGGLLDVALDPAFASNSTVYFTYAEADAANPNLTGTAVARAVINTANRSFIGWQVIYRQTPKVASSGHYGSRLAFARDGSLIVSLGDRQTSDQQGFAQDLSRGNGKVVRITTDGLAAAGNPFVGRAGAQPEIWSLGHRNPQGLAVHPDTGDVWLTEHGPQGGDELNVVQAGRNYGWPLISWGQEYGTTNQVGSGTAQPGLEQPVSYWLTADGSAYTSGAKSSIAPSGLMIYNGGGFPAWRGHVFTGALAGKALWRVQLGGADGKTEVARERLLVGLNERIRDVRQGPDGWIYVLTDGERGRLIRLSQ
jgi:aldose sugar dehydrogenase